METWSRHKYFETRKCGCNKSQDYWQLNLVAIENFKSRLKNKDSQEKAKKKKTTRISKLRHTPEGTKDVKKKVSRDKEIHVVTRILEKEDTIGKTHVAIENLVTTRIKGMSNKLSRDKETGSRQPNEKAAKNSVVIEDIRS